jgi:5-methylcytosine-specific restriction enzyme subunit McrC
VEQSTYQVAGQPKMPWHEAWSAVPEDAGLLPIMRPDVVLISPRRRIILDTKFYREPLMVSRYGGRRVRPSHLYQLFAYLENRNAWAPDGPPHEGLLLYPVVQDAFRLDFRLKGHRIQVRTIDLDQDWREIREDLLEMVA